ncbi:MAG TPA: endonuclease/exonuclease/phosphatase family protein [Tepidisphaeraceae bacterium]|nr:endonuclease/exonuclease/phosphatase family protein [Tepidisphaeraceae bacterium]
MSQANDLRVMSYNIRNTQAPDGPNHWVHRRDVWKASVRAFSPDLLGLQEVWVDQHDELREDLGDYGFAGVARDDGKRSGEWAMILYRLERFELLDVGNFWLSETPAVAGSKSWDSKHVRICSWVRVRDRLNGATLLHANTHLDDMGTRARAEGAKLIRRVLPELAGGGVVVLTGDFNSTEVDEPYAALLSRDTSSDLQLSDSYRLVHPQASANESTFHSFSDRTEGRRIDWILHSPHLAPVAATIDRYRAADGRYPSDHYAVTATFRWNDTRPPTGA